MILIKNNIKKIKINESLIKKNVAKILDLLGYKNFDIGILFTTNKTIKKFNQKYRQKNNPTDILSFPYHENLKPGQKIKISTIDDQNLGDIIISLEYAKIKSENLNISLQNHLKNLIVHGIAHLLGYDHQTEKDYKLMHAFEKKLLRKISY
ncbi:rRNA maturation RNase YbeY [Candidatus Dependentiae bacterium]|nr:rRNA maturation RNase YbeY [Candidatus Dependentiae bacterium]